MSLTLVTAPPIEPVSVSDMHDWLRLDTTADDALITGLIPAARAWCEEYTQRRFIQQQWNLGMDFFPGYIDLKLAGTKVSSPFVSGSNAVLVGIRYAIVLPFPPIVSIDAFTYQDGNGHTTTMVDGTDFVKDLESQPARLTPPFGNMWPVARVIVEAVNIKFTCGYGETEADVPAGIQTAIKLLTAHWYENRVPDESSIPMAVKAVLGPYRDLRL